MAAAEGKQCLQECQGPAEKAAPKSKPAPAEKHLEADASALCCAGSGGIARPISPPHCSLQDLPVEMLVEIFASLQGTDLASLAQACTKSRHILHTDSIWRLCCHQEFGVQENLQKPEMIDGMSYREVYAKMFPYKNLLGLWQLDYGYRRLLNVVVDDGLCITGWMYRPCLNTHVAGPMQFEPLFRIHLTQRKSAMVEYTDHFYSFSHSRHMQIQKDRFSNRWIQRDPRQDSPTRLRGGRWLEMSQEDRQLYDRLTYRHLPGLFLGKSDGFGLMIAMLSFHGKYAWVTKITGDLIWTLESHLMRHIHLPDGKTFHNFKELSRVVQEIEEQVIREQQQQENRTEESEGHGWQSPGQPSIGESWAAPSEEQPVPFVLPVGLRSRDQNYPSPLPPTCRMYYYGVHIVTLHGSAYPRRCPGVFILFDENHFGFICVSKSSPDDTGTTTLSKARDPLRANQFHGALSFTKKRELSLGRPPASLGRLRYRSGRLAAPVSTTPDSGI
ncbi:F-box only protein 31-like [Myotis yumanensis]|uniref:F-box only protein 31-like n=1 Tax=Myotis yumanensis TaxID=159337 RepID=UPI0038D4F632